MNTRTTRTTPRPFVSVGEAALLLGEARVDHLPLSESWHIPATCCPDRRWVDSDPPHGHRSAHRWRGSPDSNRIPNLSET